MAVDPSALYPGQVDTSDPTGYPHGKAQNSASLGDGIGWPLEKAWVNDLLGFEAALLADAGLTPSGTPDKVGASQYLDALKAVSRSSQLLHGALKFTSTRLSVGTSSLTRLSAVQQTAGVGAPANRQSQILASGTTTLPAPAFEMLNDGTSPAPIQNFGSGTGGAPTSAPACDASGVFFYGDSSGGVWASSDGGASSSPVTVTLLTTPVLWVGFTASHYLVYEDTTHKVFHATALAGTWNYVTVPGYVTGMTTNGTGTWVLFVVNSGASTILYSTDDGVTFTSAATVGGPGSNVNGAWSDQLGLFVALEKNAGGLWTSPNGITWTLSKTVASLAGVPFLQQSVAVCGPVIACVVNRAVNSINKHPYGIAYTLDAGATWNEVYFGDPTGGNPISGLISANGRLYAIDGAAIYQSGLLVAPAALYTGV